MSPLPTHGRYPYSAITARPVYDWPERKRLAIYIALNLEWFAFGEGLGAELAPRGPQPDVLNYAWRDYGNRVGVFRLAELFAELKLPVSLLLNSAMAEEAPQAIAAFPDAEIVGHGRSNSERQGDLTEFKEQRLIEETTKALEKHTRRRPQGWLGPWISQSRVTPDLLQEAGYSYLLDWCHDDQPVWMKTRKGRILSLPYPQELNDIPQIVARKREGANFADMIMDSLRRAADRMQIAAAGDGDRLAPLHRRAAAPLQVSRAGADPHHALCRRTHLVHHGGRHRRARRQAAARHRALKITSPCSCRECAAPARP